MKDIKIPERKRVVPQPFKHYYNIKELLEWESSYFEKYLHKIVMQILESKVFFDYSPEIKWKMNHTSHLQISDFLKDNKCLLIEQLKKERGLIPEIIINQFINPNYRITIVEDEIFRDFDTVFEIYGKENGSIK